MLDAAALQEPDIASSPIPLGATRPAMIPRVGIPLAAGLPLMVLGAEVQMAVTGLWGAAYAAVVVVAAALPLRVWISHDWYGLEVLRVWLRTSALTFDNELWGGASLSPAPIGVRHLRKELRGMAA